MIIEFQDLPQTTSNKDTLFLRQIYVSIIKRMKYANRFSTLSNPIKNCDIKQWDVVVSTNPTNGKKTFAIVTSLYFSEAKEHNRIDILTPYQFSYFGYHDDGRISPIFLVITIHFAR